MRSLCGCAAALLALITPRRGQIEYYLSEQNLANDTFLRSKMDAGQTVPLALLAGFPRLKALCPSGLSGTLPAPPTSRYPTVSLGTIAQTLPSHHALSTSVHESLRAACRRGVGGSGGGGATRLSERSGATPPPSELPCHPPTCIARHGALVARPARPVTSLRLLG
jgi:hypothetical protein